MDRTVHQILKALADDVQIELQALGDFPKAKKFDHGCQVGRYMGLKLAMERIETVLNDIAEEDSRR